MLYLNKLLLKIKENPAIFKTPEIILIIGLSNSQIKDLKKYALENQLITQTKQGVFLTQEGESYLAKNPIEKWKSKEYSLRPEINVEYFKEDKIPAILTKAIRNYAKHLLENQPLKEFSLDFAIKKDLESCKALYNEIKNKILIDKKICINNIYEYFSSKGITKSLFSIILLTIINENIEKIAIYEKSQFQLKFDTLMFDRMIACPQNFELQKTEMENQFLLKDISKIILNKNSNNILEITKGLYAFIKSLDKYTMNTQNLTSKTLRLRNVIVNAKDPISLFERDIPKVLSNKYLQDCDREFLNSLKISLSELKNCTDNLVKDLEKFILKSFQAKTREELTQRFLKVIEYIGENELKILLNNVIETEIPSYLWTNRIATFINKFRIPKDWTDEDYANFKIKTKELALKFFVIETTVGTNCSISSKKYHTFLNNFLKLSKEEQLTFLREFINA